MRRLDKISRFDDQDRSWTQEVSDQSDTGSTADPTPDADQKKKQDEAKKKNPNFVYQQLVATLGKIIPNDIIMTKIFPSVNEKGLNGTPKEVGGGKLVFEYRDGTQGIWSAKNKQYSETQSSRNYKNIIIKKANFRIKKK